VKPVVFVGSSSEHRSIAEAVTVNLDPVAEIRDWKHAFRPGQPTFSDLMEIKDRVDSAVMILTAADLLISRSKTYAAPRDNLIFELGLFLGSLGSERVFVLLDENIDTKLMSDYDGVSVIPYNPICSDNNIMQALNPACVRIKQEINRLCSRSDNQNTKSILFPGELIGLETTYDNMIAAEPFLLQDIKSNSGPIRLFFHIASQNTGLSGSLFDIID